MLKSEHTAFMFHVRPRKTRMTFQAFYGSEFKLSIARQPTHFHQGIGFIKVPNLLHEKLQIVLPHQQVPSFENTSKTNLKNVFSKKL